MFISRKSYKPKTKHLKQEVVSDLWHTGLANFNHNNYVTGLGKSLYLLKLISGHIETNSIILELGCSVGRNLNILRAYGYRPFGVEYSRKAITKKTTTCPINVCSIENYYENYHKAGIMEILGNKIDLTFSMISLGFLMPESEWVFKEMVETSRYIATIENEVDGEPEYVARDYREIFTNLGCKQVKHLGTNFNPFFDGFWEKPGRVHGRLFKVK